MCEQEATDFLRQSVSVVCFVWQVDVPCVHHPINSESPDAWWVDLIGRFKSMSPPEALEMDSDGTCLSIWERCVSMAATLRGDSGL